MNSDVSWKFEYSALHRELLELSDRELVMLEDEKALNTYLSFFIPGLASIRDWSVPSASQTYWQTPAKALHGLPGRKRRQTEGFVSAVTDVKSRPDPNSSGKPKIVDWCSGRGLLARQLHYASNSQVLCLERDRELCESGKTANGKMDSSMAQDISFLVQDVLCEMNPRLFEGSYLHTALHACGDLHLSMLKQSSRAQVPRIACAPCCYHLIQDDLYRGLSREARTLGFKPTSRELRLATAETCTANAKERELRQRELLWRVAFDLRLRDLTQNDVYRPTPSVKKSLLKTSFDAYCQFTTTQLQTRGLPSLQHIPLAALEEQELLDRAQGKLDFIKRLEKAQLGFRKVLEYWLLLDRALYLQEQGYKVQLQEFCEKADSARNILILGRL